MKDIGQDQKTVLTGAGSENIPEDAFELKDEYLEQINGGVSWPKFAQAALGVIDPAQYPELVSAIVEHNWVQVAIITVPLVATDPLIAKLFRQA